MININNKLTAGNVIQSKNFQSIKIFGEFTLRRTKTCLTQIKILQNKTFQPTYINFSQLISQEISLKK